MRIFKYGFLTGGDMSGNVTSSAVQLDYTVGYSIQAAFTGTPSGSLKLQASVDGTNYSDITDTSTTIAAAGSFLWNVADPNYDYVRLVYTRTGSTGVLSATIFSKGF